MASDDNMIAVYEAQESRSARDAMTEMDRAAFEPDHGDDEVQAALARRRGRGW
ncbi:hypothetical protein SEA_CRACKLEWINK_73 [Mycobacterium phage Cracklewink]|uniref:Uncharacterized protein n=1 Tax=Mycobacterium phage Bipper TaxID=1805457 RepID=A0A142F2K2_9CAUD|nr:hypothetical protein KCH39_gp103 [Mycobacterium phage Bipper]AMQ67009.1 hypothetical protein SEA_BIPPER_74 [Mycobacterium phage Bipper]QDF19359.1 hypothetical protein SEA_CRACKLEWINK_73 [Mycobacterium phage Cracklewink]